MNDYQAYAMSETWLDDSFYSGELFDLNSFQVFRADRKSSKKRGGDCLVAIGKKYRAKEFLLTVSQIDDFINIDVVGVLIKCQNKQLLIIVVYIPPDTLP